MISLWALERQLDVTGLALLTARSAARLCEQALVRQALRRSSARLVCPAEDSREQAASKVGQSGWAEVDLGC